MKDEMRELNTAAPESEQDRERVEKDSEDSIDECVNHRDTDAVDVNETKPRKRKGRILICLLCIAGILGIAGISAPYVVYQYACYTMEHEQYETAERYFSRLGDFKDSAELCVKAQKMQLYEQAEAYLDGGDYTAALSAFRKLGDFLDAKEQIQKARHMEKIRIIYESAEENYQAEMYLKAYDEICKIRGEQYDGISELREQILSSIYDQMLDSWKNGNVLLARHELKLLEEIKYPEVDGLREKLVQEMHIELDSSYYDAINSNHITGFNASTTAEEYGSVVKYMYLNHIPSVTLYVNGNRPLDSTVQKRMCDGASLVDDILPELGTIYDLSWRDYYWGATEYSDTITITLRYDESASMRESIQQAEGIKVYCEETVRMLNDELLLTNTMSNQAKAHMIMEWVVNYLEYDDSMETHNAFVAIQNQSGVCESYTALYNYMCNLAGVPSFGMFGQASEDGEISDDDFHIWSIQLDEDGNVYYTDATWADIGFSSQNISRQEFVEYNDRRAEEIAARNTTDNEIMKSDRYWYGYSLDKYFWKETIWDSHMPNADFPQIQAFYQQNAD